MVKRKAEEELAWKRHTSESGAHSSIPAAAPNSERPKDPDTQVSSVINRQSDVWQRVSYWIDQLSEDDPRRRLLELAQLRRDVKLADVLLRNL